MSNKDIFEVNHDVCIALLI